MIELTALLFAGLSGPLRIDVDSELMNSKFGGDVHQAAVWTQAVASDLGMPVEFRVDRVVTWSSDPFGSHTDSFQALLAYEQFVNNTHVVSILLTGAGTGSDAKGAAVQNSACDRGVAVVFVPWAMPDAFAAAKTRELIVHELGHTFDLDHSHCQSTPLDMCWSGGGFLGQFGAACYRGPTSCPAEGRGSAMSICSYSACGQLNGPLHESQAAQMLHVARSKNCLEFGDGFE